MTRSDHLLARRRFFRPLLEQLEDRRLLATITVTGTGDTIAVDGLVTLREAITAANTNLASGDSAAGSAGLDTINFNIAGTGVKTITPASTLPAITDPVIIDGYTQGLGTPDPSDDAKPNTLAVGSDAVLLIEINRSAFTGFLIQFSGGGSGSTVRGLVISNVLDGSNSFNIGFSTPSNNNTIAGNFIGTDAAGAVALGGTAVGILVGGGSTGNTIGGTTPADRNVIVGGLGVEVFGGGNFVQGNYVGLNAAGTAALLPIGATGIRVEGLAGNNTIGGTTPGASNVIVAFGTGILLGGQGNLVQGNLIGTNATGTAALGGAIFGVGIDGNSNTIGGAAAGAGNLISGHQEGIHVFGGANAGTIIQGNKIGTDITGTAAIPNSTFGINLASFTVTNSSIGGVNPGEGNTIAFNGAHGVMLGGSPGAGWSFLGNSIFSNVGKAISLNGCCNPPLPNDVGDADTGANNLQNYPVLVEVLSTAVDSTIIGLLNSQPRTDFLIQFFANDAADPSGFGEGQTFLGATIVHTNSTGNVRFSADVPALLTPDQQVTSTATRLFDHDANPNTPSVPTDTSEFSQAISGATSILELDGPTIERDLPLNNEFSFRLDVPPGIDARLTAHFTDPQIGEIFVRRGDLPDVNDFEERVVAFVKADPEFLLAGFSVPYFISVRGTSTAGVPLGHFSLTAETVGLEIGRITPNHGSNAGQVTATIFGTGFSTETVFSLVGNGAERLAANIVPQSETSFFVTFDLAGLATGSYGVRAVGGANSTELASAFIVTTGNPGRFEARVLTPAQVFLGRESTLFVEYANPGETDIPAPLVTFTSQNAFFTDSRLDPTRFGSPPEPPRSTVAQFLAVSQTGPAGVLPPGARGRLEFRFKDDGTLIPHEFLKFELFVAGPESDIFDLAAAKDELRPPDVAPGAWDVVFSNLRARFGSTVGGYVQALRDAATYLSNYGIYTNDVGRLLSLYFAQADNSLPGGSPHSAIDATAPASGVPLIWGRTFAPAISRRFDLGILGRGWSHPWDHRLSRDLETNDVLIRTPDGTRRFLEQSDGSFLDSLLDPAQLTLQGGVFSLRETDGTVSRFDEVTGLGLDVTDRNGHKVTLNYAAGTLVSLVHSNGERFDFGYNGAGRLTQLTDHAGRGTTYEYDAAGEHLIKVTGPGGVWEYAYETTVGAHHEHALESVTRPDGTHLFYEYDGQGRLLRTSRDGNAEAVTFAYGSVGEVFLTDGMNNTTSLFFNDIGQLLETRDAQGHSARLDYDLVSRPDRATLPLDTVSFYDFDHNGNLTFIVKPDGGSLNFTFDTTFNLPATVRDERSIPLRYTYDSQGNITSILRADGSVEQFTPDADGNITQTINRRSQAIDYTYDTRGMLLRKDHADGTFESFTYDERGNLLTATDEAGSTTFAYDLADRLTNVTYPTGRFLQYTYDAGGRRIRLADQDGFIVNYAYDVAGRIAELTDGTDARLVLYTYDPVGRLIREDKANGTFTKYEYDAAGQLLRLVNHAEDGLSNSEFAYTYNELGLRTSVTALDGVTTWGYDAVGQLISVALPGGRTIAYVYDAVGNRVSVTDNGAVTNYAANDVQEYLAVGSAVRAYDADGNLISETVGGQTSTYAYDDENRLVSVVTPAGTWTYEYDALGNRIATIENGQRTDYLLDPTGLVNVAGEYDSAGSLVARYVHSNFGLVSRFDVSGAAAFYDFDSPGSTVALTAADGTILNSYSYLPFGETLSSTESVANPFTYIGSLGVMAESNGLSFMRERFYQSQFGAFTSIDPLRLPGGDIYTYANNNPTLFVDPLGLQAGGQLCFNGLDYEECAPPPPPPPGEEKEKPFWGSMGNNKPAPGPSLSLGCVGGMGPLALLGAIPTNAEGEVVDPCKPSPPKPPKPPKAPGTPGGSSSVEGVVSGDPNDIIGPAGFGPDHFLTADSSLFYTIRFENLAEATAPAQEVVITQTLDPDLDLATFELLSFGVGGSVVNLPAGRSSFSLQFDLRPDRNLLLDVGADLNFQTGVITWTFTSLDPATLELTADPQGGFLPPNQSPPQGEGFVTYFVRPKPALPTGTRIDAQARIVFDVNAPIDTPAIFHTFDAGPPTSSVDSLPAVTSSESFSLRWSGTDDPNGSGIASYNIYVSVDGGAFAPFLLGTTETTAQFTGEIGHSYAFYSGATDNVGHVEATPTVADAATSIINAPPLLAAIDGDDLITIAETTVPLAAAVPVDFALSASDANAAQTLDFSLGVTPADDPAAAGATLYDPANPAHTSLLLVSIASQTAIPGSEPDEASAATGILRIQVGPNAAGGQPSSEWCFRIQVSDGTGGVSNRTVRLTVNRTNASPSDLDLIGSSVAENAPPGTVVGTLSVSDLDAEESHVFTLTDGAGGRFQMTGNQLSVADSSLLDFESAGSHTIEVTATDLSGALYSETFVITLTNVDEAPVASNVSVLLAEDQPTSVTLAATDPEGGAVIYSIVDSPLHGTLSGIAPNLTYSPLPNYHGSDSFTYRASVGSSDSNLAMAAIVVTAVNDRPTANGQSISTLQGAAVSGTLTGDDGDQEVVQSLTYSIAAGPAHGVIDLDQSTGAFTYHPSAGYSGPDSFTFTAQDDSAAGLPGSLVSAATTVAIVVAANPGVTPGAEVVAGVLRIVGTPHADLVGITRLFGQVIVTATFLPGGLRVFPASSIDRVDARLREGNDLLIVAGNVGVPAILDGGNGDDLIYGGGGTSIILGGAGNDLLFGGPGRNVIIGGTGRDTLLGGAASDLLIAGTTAYDNNDAALRLVLQEWTSSRSYADRVANLRGGLGPILNASGTRLKKGETVLDDLDVDELFGGSELDWLLYDLSRDIARDKKSGEAVN